MKQKIYRAIENRLTCTKYYEADVLSVHKNINQQEFGIMICRSVYMAQHLKTALLTENKIPLK